MARWRRPILLAAMGPLGAQAGHLLTYQLRFGAAASQLQSSGAHAYFPTVAKVGVGLAASVVIGGLFVVGLARLLARGRAQGASSAPSYLALLAGLYTLQLACYAGQETVEATLAGVPVSSAEVLLLWGTLGQLPVAALAAAALRWLLAEFEAAVTEIRAALTLVVLRAELVPALVAMTLPPGSARALRPAPPLRRPKRGPPSFLRLSF